MLAEQTQALANQVGEQLSSLSTISSDPSALEPSSSLKEVRERKGQTKKVKTSLLLRLIGWPRNWIRQRLAGSSTMPD